MKNAGEIKKIIIDSGADLCGVASADRFNHAPEGFRPTDLYPDAQTVIVFAKKLPESIYYSQSYIPYTFIDNISSQEISRLTFDITVKLEKNGIIAMPVPSEPYEYWDKDTMTGKGMLSLKHAGHLAGLGVIGRNDLLCNPEHGNLIKLGAVITNAPIDADPIINYDFCSDQCNLCITHCPSGALNTKTVIQKNCRLHSEGTTKKGAPITICNNCRKICPNRAGWQIKTT